MSSLWRLKPIALGILLVAAASIALAQVPNAACPDGTLLFGLGDSAGCIKPGTNEVVVKCFRQKTCSPGWKGAGVPDDSGRDLCCPPPTVHRATGCSWFGTAPICRGRCPHGWQDKGGSADGKGNGEMSQYFGKPCWSGLKELCCNPKY